jgi:hypothetical protein
MMRARCAPLDGGAGADPDAELRRGSTWTRLRFFALGLSAILNSGSTWTPHRSWR